MRHLIIILAVFIFSSNGVSQDFFFSNIDANINYGFIAPHRVDMQHLNKGRFPGFSISIGGNTDGSREWHKQYRYPYLSIAFSYADMAYPEVLGKAYAVIPHIKFPLIRTSGYSLHLRHGLGLAYLTKKYEMYENYKNTAIGSHLNLAYTLSFDNQFKIKDKYHIIAGVAFTHYSNGRTIAPNRGLNIPSLKLGFSFGEHSTPILTQENSSEKSNKSSELLIIASGGTTALYPVGSGSSPRAGINALFNYPINSKIKFGIGYDFFYYYNKPHLLTHVDPDKHVCQHVNHGISVAYQMGFGKMAFLIHKGVYLYDKHDFQRSFFYHRAGFRYTVFDNIVLNLTMKTHFFQAQFIEMGIGYKIF